MPDPEKYVDKFSDLSRQWAEWLKQARDAANAHQFLELSDPNMKESLGKGRRVAGHSGPGQQHGAGSNRRAEEAEHIGHIDRIPDQRYERLCSVA